MTSLLVVVMSSISLIYIFTKVNNFTINYYYIGIIGWMAISCATIYLSLNYLKECLVIFVVFFTLGFSTQAYLEPISDQIDHLYKTYERCENIDYGSRINRGFWQYNMNGLLLCQTKNVNYTPVQVLKVIDLLHGLYIGMACVILFLIGRISGLPAKWSFLAVCMALFFMGTNKFSYFRYYSYSDSFTSILMYWLWIGFFFFKKSFSKNIVGTVTAILLIIILSVNHIQEAVFLAFIVSFWIILNVTELIISWKKNISILSLWFMMLFLIFFILPQYKQFQEILNHVFMANWWDKNQSVVYHWYNLHLMGRIWVPQYRVVETIGIMGFTPLFLSPFLLCWNQKKFPISIRIRIVLLGILPFLIFCTPLCHYIWLANVAIPVYYRIAYSSLFWCTIVFYLFMIETRIRNFHINGVNRL